MSDASLRPAGPWRGLALGRLVQLVCFLGVAFVVLLGALSIGLHFRGDPAAAAYFTDKGIFQQEEIETGLLYGFQGKLIAWTATLVNLAFLAVMALTPWGLRVVAACRRLTGDRWLLTIIVLALGLHLAQEVLSLPLGLAGFHYRRWWNMSDRTLAAWFIDFLKGAGVSAVLEVAPLVALFALIRWQPRRWWMPAALAAPLLGIAIAYLHPLVIAPVFNTFTPLSQTQWAGLEPRVRQLVASADLPIREVLVIDASRQGRHTNAYFTGFGPSRSIVLYDTLLARHSDDEIISVLAHEIGHWQHNHIVKGLALASLGALAALFVLSRLLLALVGRAPWRATAPSDPVLVPLVVLLTVLANWMSLPVQNAVSRHFERQADAVSLDLGNPAAFVASEVQMCRTNLSNVTPHPLLVWFFASHPTALERIEAGRARLAD